MAGASTVPPGYCAGDVAGERWRSCGAAWAGRANLAPAKRDYAEEVLMEWFWIGGGIVYLVLLFTLGVLTIRKGHWVMFILGLFIPLFWIIGALMPPRVPR